MNRFDVIVLGLGAAGSATLYQLAKRGAKVLGIDQFSPPHTFGSTHGDTRITRLAIGEGAHYTPLAIRSHQIWRELEAKTGARLLTTNGGLIISGATSRSTFHGASFFSNTLDAARRQNIPHELRDAEQIRQRFAPLAIDDEQGGYFEPSAGFVRPEECIRVQLALAEALGANIVRNQTVTEFAQGGNVVKVRIKADTFEAAQLIVAAGPWLPGLLAENHSRHFKIYRQTLHWFDIEACHDQFVPERFPVFIWELPGAKGGIYGFPAIDGPKGGIKVATEQFEVTTRPHSVNREVSAVESERIYRDLVAPYIRGVGSKCVKSAVCLYTVTRDFGFVIDRHPDFDRIIIASPCSGHGFKHSAALGEAISDLASGITSRFDLSAFALSRLTR